MKKCLVVWSFRCCFRRRRARALGSACSDDWHLVALGDDQNNFKINSNPNPSLKHQGLFLFLLPLPLSSFFFHLSPSPFYISSPLSTKISFNLPLNWDLSQFFRHFWPQTGADMPKPHERDLFLQYFWPIFVVSRDGCPLKLRMMSRISDVFPDHCGTCPSLVQSTYSL